MRWILCPVSAHKTQKIRRPQRTWGFGSLAMVYVCTCMHARYCAVFRLVCGGFCWDLEGLTSPLSLFWGEREREKAVIADSLSFYSPWAHTARYLSQCLPSPRSASITHNRPSLSARRRDLLRAARDIQSLNEPLAAKLVVNSNTNPYTLLTYGVQLWISRGPSASGYASLESHTQTVSCDSITQLYPSIRISIFDFHFSSNILSKNSSETRGRFSLTVSWH